MKVIDKAIADWAKEKKEELGEEICTLIHQANFDLYNGPSGVDGEDEERLYPGFTTACRKVSEALADIGDMYIDPHIGILEESEPADDNDGCDYFRVTRNDLVKAIVGAELLQYVR
jgi:hypothetical protein